MKTLLCLLLSLSSSAFASNSLRFYSLQTNYISSEYELARECSSDAEQAAQKLTEISTRLAGKADALVVAGYYGWTSNEPTFPMQPKPGTEFYCILKFTSYDPVIHFDSFEPVSFTHLSSATWDTACKPAYDDALANPDSPVTLYWKSLTLFQGRMCSVTTVTALHN